jgi:hypothetical protein
MVGRKTSKVKKPDKGDSKMKTTVVRRKRDKDTRGTSASSA